MINVCFWGFLPILIFLGFREASKIIAHNIVMSLADAKVVLFGFDFGTLVSFEDVTVFLQINSIYVTALCNVICIIIFFVMFRKDENVTRGAAHPGDVRLARTEANVTRGQSPCHTFSVPALIRSVVASLGIAIAVSNLIHLSGLDGASAGYQIFQANYSSKGIIPLLVCTGILAPISEELCFRGLMYRRMKPLAGEGPAMVVSALCFGVVHGNIAQFVYAAVLGLFFAYFYECTGNILVPILSHLAVNFLASFMTTYGVLDWMYKNNLVLIGATLIYASLAAMMIKDLRKK